MEEKKSFLMFYDWEPLLQMLDREDVGDLLMALYAYEIRNEIPEANELTPTAWGLFNYLSNLFDENKNKWLQKQSSGSLGGKRSAEARKNKAQSKQDPSKDQAEDKQDPSTNQADPKEIQPKDKVKDKVKVNVKEEIEISPNGDTKKRAFSLRDVDGIIDEYLIIRDREDIRKVIKEFFAAKKQAKKTISETAVRRNIKKALDLANNNPDQVKELFELALERGWQGIYEDNSQSGIAKATRQKIEDIDWMALYGKEDAQ